MASLSDENLNAFIDGELAVREFEAILAALCRDEGLRLRVSELLGVKAMVRHAYAAPPTPASHAPTNRRSGRLLAALAVATLIAVGLFAAIVVHAIPGDEPAGAAAPRQEAENVLPEQNGLDAKNDDPFDPAESSPASRGRLRSRPAQPSRISRQ